ncbi:hypothetical protein [Halosimplex salinum]|uniref:hypothetical protein n=1 Tax=Halosimplex salinum TaxID=1710538 RepID=UPI000F468853|nr:hypothetical protein [Halosimplex salinum]
MNRPALLPDDTVSRALVTVGIAVLVVGVVVGAIAPAAGVSGLGGSDAAGEPRQTDPAEAGGEGDLSAVERQLADRLADRARSGAINVSSGDVDEARERLNGTEYEALVEQYSSVANETGNADQTIAYRRMLETQREFVETVDRYNRIHQRYQSLRSGEYTATDFGDARIRPDLSEVESGGEKPMPGGRGQVYRHAHELSRLADDVEETGGLLDERYRTLSNVSGQDFTEGRASIDETVENVTARQATVRDETFRPTELRVDDYSRTASFSNPLSVAGRVTANGSAVSNGTVRLSVGNQTAETETDANGSFNVDHRPALVSTNVSSATVAYVPANDSADAPAEQTLKVEFRQETPAVDVSVAPDEIRYGERLRVTGQVSVDGVGVPNAPYIVLVDGQVFARNETDSAGRYDVSERFPSSVGDGEQRVRVLVPLENRTLAGASANATLQVAELATDLTANATHVEGRTVRVEGHLSSANGHDVDNETVGLAVDGTTVATTETDANGSFATTIAVPSEALDGGLLGGSQKILVTASYEDATSNLAPVGHTTDVTVRAPGRPVLLGGLALLVVGLVGGVVLARRRPWETGGERGVSGAGQPGIAASDLGGSVSASADSASLLSTARDRLASDPETAVRVGYAALRHRIERQGAVPGDGRTHWEFYRDCRDADLDAETLDALRDVTERYERVAYAAGAVDADAARATLDRIESFVDGSLPDGPGQTDQPGD